MKTEKKQNDVNTYHKAAKKYVAESDITVRQFEFYLGK